MFKEQKLQRMLDMTKASLAAIQQSGQTAPEAVSAFQYLETCLGAALASMRRADHDRMMVAVHKAVSDLEQTARAHQVPFNTIYIEEGVAVQLGVKNPASTRSLVRLVSEIYNISTEMD